MASERRMWARRWRVKGEWWIRERWRVEERWFVRNAIQVTWIRSPFSSEYSFIGKEASVVWASDSEVSWCLPDPFLGMRHFSPTSHRTTIGIRWSVRWVWTEFDIINIINMLCASERIILEVLRDVPTLDVLDSELNSLRKRQSTATNRVHACRNFVIQSSYYKICTTKLVLRSS